jgi:hypothetical protein
MRVAVLVAVPALAAAQTQSQREPVVQVGIYGYRADGTIGVSAGDSAERGPELGTTVYLMAQPQRCGMGAGNRRPPADAADAWEFTGRVLSATREEAIVQLNWRRLVVQGRTVNGDESSTQLTLRVGESVQLDQATPGCETVSVAFEAKYVPRFSGVGQPAGGGAGGRVSVGPAGGMAAVNMAGGGRGSGPARSVPVAQAGGEGGGVKIGADSSSGEFDVNLWLVRSLPGQPDEVRHSLLRMNQEGVSFGFPPVAIATARGTALVQVSGSLAVTRSDAGAKLVFATSRRVTTTTAGQPRDHFRDVQGSSRTTNPLPGPDEVLAFEMPLISMDGQEAPDKFSIRVKIAPHR